MTAWPDGTALWLRGTNEVVDGKEGLPPSISPPNTSCQGLRDLLALTVACNSAGSALSFLFLLPVLASQCLTAGSELLVMNVSQKVSVGNLATSDKNGMGLNR